MPKFTLAIAIAASFALTGCGSLGGGLNLSNLPVPIYFLNNGQPVQVGQVGLMLMPAQPAGPVTAAK